MAARVLVTAASATREVLPAAVRERFDVYFLELCVERQLKARMNSSSTKHVIYLQASLEHYLASLTIA